MFGGFGQVHGGTLGFLGCRGYLQGCLVNGLYQRPQLVDGVVDGVGDGAGEVLGYRGFGGQVTVGEVGNFVQQTQNRRLVTLVGSRRLRQTLTGFAGHLQTDQQNTAQRDDTQQVTEQGVEPATAAALFKRLRQVGDVIQQNLGVSEDVVRCSPY